MEKEKFGAAVISFLQEYYGRHKKILSTATLFKSFNKTRFYEVFPQGLAQACRVAGIPVPEERLKRTQKALRATSKKRVEEASPLQDLKQSYEIQQREEQRREEFAEKRAEELAIMLQDSNEAISRPVLDAIEKTALPILLEKKYGIDASVPEILEMLKQYMKAVDEGWYLEHIMEWGILSEDEREAFTELCTKAYSEERVSPTRYLVTLKGAIENLKGKKDQLLTEIVELNQKKRGLNWNCSLLEAQHNKLKKDHEEREKQLDDEYYEKGKDYAIQFSMTKKQKEDEINKLTDERERLKTECDLTEKRTVSLKAEAREAVKERDMARSELKQLRALAGPKGAVSDLAKRNEDLKAQLAEKDRQLADKWLNQEEALQTFNGESKRFMGEVEGVCHFASNEVEHRINNAGSALRVLEFLESDLPDEKFRELTFAINLAEVKRESLNPDNPYFAHLSARKKELLGVFPTTEEYQRLHKEMMENLHKRREDHLQKIREAAGGIATIETWGKIGENLLNNVVKPMVEAYLNPKETASDDSAHNDRKEPDRSS